MKNIFLIGGLLLILVACSKDFLEKDPAIITLTDNALSTSEGLEVAVYSLYDFPRIALRHRVYNYYFIAGTELLKTNGLLSEDMGMSLYTSELNSTHAPGENYWSNSFRALNHANSIIDRAEKVGFTDDERKNRLVAEARFFRAYILFYLEQRWENIPLITSEITVPRDDFTPASKTEIYNVITNDLIFASTHLDQTYDEIGRITKGAAQHLLAKVYMVLEQWANAAEMANSVIESGVYDFVSDRSQLWADNSQNNSEAVYVLQFAIDPGDEPGHQMAQQFQPLIDRIPGVARTFSQGGRPWARYYPSDYLLGLFEEDDIRLSTDYKTAWIYDDEANLPITILPNGATDSVTINVGDTVQVEHVSNPTLWFGPACKKYWEYGGHGRTLSEVESRKSIIRYRLSETYLIAAEALWRDDKPAEALVLINEIRKNAGVEEFTELNEDIILEERIRELAFEQHHWFTLKRMGRLVSAIKNNSPDKEVTEVQEHNTKMPIPQSFLDATPGYPQNDGY